MYRVLEYCWWVGIQVVGSYVACVGIRAVGWNTGGWELCIVCWYTGGRLEYEWLVFMYRLLE